MTHRGNCAHESRTQATPNMPVMRAIDESVIFTSQTDVVPD